MSAMSVTCLLLELTHVVHHVPAVEVRDAAAVLRHEPATDPDHGVDVALGDVGEHHGSGNFHSDDMRVVERYELTGPNSISYSATIYDASVFTEPWTITMPLYRRVDRQALMEFKCVEFVEELIYGQWRKNPLP